MGNESFTIWKNITKLINKYYPQIKLNIIFTNNFNINNFFRFKDQVPNSLRSCVVYKYNCDSCNATYVGKTTRHFSTRISEHLGISHRSGIRLTSPPFSAIRNHVQYEKDHHQNYNLTPNQFKIISSANSDFENLKYL